MKRIIFLITLICTGVTQAQIVNIPDDNFKNYLLSNNNININGDNEIQITEANSFDGVLNMDNRNIADLTGLEEFTNIWRIRASNNQLTSIDLSGNINLGRLSLYDNNLTEIDLSNNLNLLSIGLSNNPISNINLSNNILLD